MRIPEICPISNLARDARGLIERARQRQEPVVITQRGRDVAVLLPIELYRAAELRQSYTIGSPRLLRREDAEYFRKTIKKTITVTPTDGEAEDPTAHL